MVRYAARNIPFLTDATYDGNDSAKISTACEQDDLLDVGAGSTEDG